MGLFSEEGKHCRKEWRSNKHDTTMNRREYIDTCKSNYGNPVEEPEEEKTFPYWAIGIFIIGIILFFILSKH